MTLWEFDAEQAASLKATRASKFLPMHRIDDAIAITGDLKQAAQADAILLVVPAQALREVAVLRRAAATNGCRSSPAPRASSAAPANS